MRFVSTRFSLGTREQQHAFDVAHHGTVRAVVELRAIFVNYELALRDRRRPHHPRRTGERGGERQDDQDTPARAQHR